MSSEAFLREMEERYARLRTALEDTPRDGPSDHSPTEREEIERELAQLSHESEAILERLADFTDRVRELLDAHARTADDPLLGSTVAAEWPRADHLGSSTYTERGWAAIAAGEPVRAARELEHALRLAPGNADAEVLLGWAEMLLECYDSARRRFADVLVRDPSHALARANLGYVCLRTGAVDEAADHLARVLAADADRKAMLYATFYSGLVYGARGMYDDARSRLYEALELGPNLIEAYWELGRTFYLESQPDEAVAVWREGAATNPFSPWGERCARAADAVAEGQPFSFSSF